MKNWHGFKAIVTMLSTFVLLVLLAVPMSAQASSATEIKSAMDYIRGRLEGAGIVYFTYNGAACPHDSGSASCSNCNMRNMIPHAPAGLYSGETAFNSGSGSPATCVGYAYWMFFNLFGNFPYDSHCYWVNNFDDAQPGDFVNLGNHAGIFYAWKDTSKTQFYMYDGNHGDYQIHYADLPFEKGNIEGVLRSDKNLLTRVTMAGNGGADAAYSPSILCAGTNWCWDGRPGPKRNGYTFSGWSDAPEGGTMVWDADGNAVVSSKYWSGTGTSSVWLYTKPTLTVYAQWLPEGTTKLDPVKNLEATEANGSVTLRWDRSMLANGYVVQRFENGTRSWRDTVFGESVSVASAIVSWNKVPNEYIDSDIQPGKTYTYQVNAIMNTAAETDGYDGSLRVLTSENAEITITTKAAGLITQKPIIQLAGQTEDTITLTWGAVANATSFNVYAYTEANQATPCGSVSNAAAGTATSVTLTRSQLGISTSGGTYHIVVEAVGAANTMKSDHLIVAVPNVSTSLSTGVKNIVNRALQQVSMQWTPVKDVKSWGGSTTFKAGTTYAGIPYGQPYTTGCYIPFDASFDTFLNAVADGNSAFYTARGAGGGDSPYYANDCSAFVSYCYNLSPRLITSDLATTSVLTTITGGLANAQIGDCLVNSGVHAILITNIYTENGVKYFTICHQTPPKAIEQTFTEAQLTTRYVDNGYILRRLKARDSVPAPVTVGTVVTPTSISVQPKTINGAIGVENQLTATVLPANAANKTVTWSSSNPAVATVSTSGVVVGKSAGTATITATTSNGLKDTCTVTIEEDVIITAKTLELTYVVDGQPEFTLDGVATLNVYINEELVAENVTNYSGSFIDNFTYEIQVASLAEGMHFARIDGGELVGTVTEDMKTLTLYFTSDEIPDGGWEIGAEFPADLNPALYEIEYKHTYVAAASATSPGDGWVKGDAVKAYYQNSGSIVQSPYPQTETLTYVLVNSYYYHWCGTNNNCNYEKVPGKYETFHNVDLEPFTATSEGFDTNNTLVKYYMLKWKSGYSYSGAATCATSQTNAWYRMYEYQPKVLVTEYSWYKVTDWTTELDTSADSHIVRWRKVGSVMSLPATLTTIEDQAFAGISAAVVYVPSTCASIGSKAFLNCSNLVEIHIAADTQIALDAFTGCPNLTIYAPAGSTAIKVAKYNDLPYVEE